MLVWVHLMDGGLHIALAAERIFEVWGIPVTNALITGVFVSVVVVTLAFFIGRNPRLMPGRLQTAFEWLFEFVLDLMEKTLEDRALARKFFPLIMSIFIFVLALNWFEFLPFVGSVGFWHGEEFVPLLRVPTTDLNFTLALAAIAYIVIEITGIVVLGFLRYGSKFVTLNQGVIGFFMGLIELVSNLARLISFSFRLFGNIFAGEVLIAVAAYFLPVGLPLPVMLFEVFVGLVQAAIFALLTLVFIKIAITQPHGKEAAAH